VRRGGGGGRPPPPAGTGSKPIKSTPVSFHQRAVTRWRVLAHRPPYALLSMTPVTGRKHQLRKVAAGMLGAPAAGDDRYGATRAPPSRALDAAMAGAGHPRPDGALLLHCWSLAVRRPGRGGASARAPLPPYFDAALRALGWGAIADAKARACRGIVGGEWGAAGVPRGPRAGGRRAL